jgi:hypothetical protein
MKSSRQENQAQELRARGVSLRDTRRRNLLKEYFLLKLGREEGREMVWGEGSVLESHQAEGLVEGTFLARLGRNKGKKGGGRREEGGKHKYFFRCPKVDFRAALTSMKWYIVSEPPKSSSSIFYKKIKNISKNLGKFFFCWFK